MSTSSKYLSLSASMGALAGPLHGLANQEGLGWLLGLQATLKAQGKEVSPSSIKEFAWDTLKAGKVIPGYGHAVLRKTDPRYTSQVRLALPVAGKWLSEGGRVISLIKPHYELQGERKKLLKDGFLPQEHAEEVLEDVLEEIAALDFEVLETTRSPLKGSKSSRRKGVPGNVEFLSMLRPKAGD